MRGMVHKKLDKTYPPEAKKKLNLSVTQCGGGIQDILIRIPLFILMHIYGSEYNLVIKTLKKIVTSMYFFFFFHLKVGELLDK